VPGAWQDESDGAIIGSYMAGRIPMEPSDWSGKTAHMFSGKTNHFCWDFIGFLDIS